MKVRFYAAPAMGALLAVLFINNASAGDAVVVDTPAGSLSVSDAPDEDETLGSDFTGGVGQNPNGQGGGGGAYIQIVQPTSGFGPGNAASNFIYTPTSNPHP